MSKNLLTSVENHVARLVINRPDSRNALTSELLQDMLAFVLRVEQDPDMRALVITGAGEHFAAGGDVKGFAAALTQSPDELRADFERRSDAAAPLWIALERMMQPVVCAVRGFSAGAALSLVAGADYCIASENARFLLAHVGLGLVADAGSTYHLPRAIGLRKAKELAFFGDRIGAEEALRIGLVNKVVADADLERETETVVQRLVQAPAVSIGQAKRLINGAMGRSLKEQIDCETAAIGHCAASADLREGVAAFIEKRKPVFGGAPAPERRQNRP